MHRNFTQKCKLSKKSVKKRFFEYYYLTCNFNQTCFMINFCGWKMFSCKLPNCMYYFYLRIIQIWQNDFAIFFDRSQRVERGSTPWPCSVHDSCYLLQSYIVTAIWVVEFQLCVAYKMKMKVNIHFWNIQYRIGILLKY